MRCDPAPTSGLELLNNHLAELADKLRLSSADDRSGDPLAVGPPSELAASLQVVAALLADLAQECGDQRYGHLGAALGDILTTWRARPESYDGALDPSLTRLHDWLEDFFGRLDTGQSATDLADHRHWLLLLETFQDAGTPLAVISDLEHRLRAWERRWGDRDLGAAWEGQLRRRWRELAAYGAALLAGAEGTGSAAQAEPDEAVAPSRSVLLLIDSDFRRSELQRRLDQAGHRVRAVAGADSTSLGSSELADLGLVLCDNLEPSNNLVAARTALGRDRRDAGPRLVLVVGRGAVSPAAETERAVRLGADGIWMEPYHLEDLAIWLS